MISAFIICARTEAIQNDANTNNKYECQIEFHNSKSDVPHEEIDLCLNKVPKNETIHFVQVISSADGKGSYKSNQKLTDLRLKNTETYLLKDLKNVETKLVSVGRNDQLGRKVHILILTEKTLSSLVVTIPTPPANKAPETVSTKNQTALKNDDNLINLFTIFKNKLDNSPKTQIPFDKKRF